ncbi:hypothetical protein EVAR_50208_1 [Eumeta japonica]|uniref:Uncharacterized protein n=1 Tax=Eumeta variegata TaxID=151549 RepID=A0A4C1WYP5_EUMVA|nr:hypothetical protein EVAR_50208_1 [Eumeta japonica]
MTKCQINEVSLRTLCRRAHSSVSMRRSHNRQEPAWRCASAYKCQCNGRAPDLLRTNRGSARVFADEDPIRARPVNSSSRHRLGGEQTCRDRLFRARCDRRYSDIACEYLIAIVTRLFLWQWRYNAATLPSWRRQHCSPGGGDVCDDLGEGITAASRGWGEERVGPTRLRFVDPRDIPPVPIRGSAGPTTMAPTSMIPSYSHDSVFIWRMFMKHNSKR